VPLIDIFVVVKWQEAEHHYQTIVPACFRMALEYKIVHYNVDLGFKGTKNINAKSSQYIARIDRLISDLTKNHHERFLKITLGSKSTPQNLWNNQYSPFSHPRKQCGSSHLTSRDCWITK